MTEKIIFRPEGGEDTEFFIVGQSTLNGKSYILVTDAEDGDADAFIMRDDSAPEEEEALFTEVTEEEELAACAKVFADLLDGDDILLEV
ncbi:MAG: DUF1292 domain-containing protein [Lachnospiraceae bacterium]|nr:DUF1292 domain-containing protein [Lachnospiraceae bacterium]